MKKFAKTFTAITLVIASLATTQARADFVANWGGSKTKIEGLLFGEKVDGQPLGNVNGAHHTSFWAFQNDGDHPCTVELSADKEWTVRGSRRGHPIVLHTYAANAAFGTLDFLGVLCGPNNPFTGVTVFDNRVERY